MTAIFISHRSTDAAEARFLKDWLGRQGHQQLFLDFDPADGIPAGVDWEQRLYRELRRCQAVLIALTPAWLESMWCRNELAIAREKGKAVFVARMKPGAAGPLIPSLQEVDLTQDRDGGLIKLARGLKEHGLDPADAFDWQPGRPIYPGLAAFDVDDAAIFFGRSEESWQLVEILRRMRLQAVGAPKLLCDPEEVDVRAKSDQRLMAEHWGGPAKLQSEEFILFTPPPGVSSKDAWALGHDKLV